MLKIVVFPSNGAGFIKIIKEKSFQLEEMQKVVGGYIEIVTLTSSDKSVYKSGDSDKKSSDKFILVCNEEGLIYDLPKNMNFKSIRGNCFITKAHGDEFISLTDKETEYVLSGALNF